jgi:hypothetical protein
MYTGKVFHVLNPAQCLKTYGADTELKVIPNFGIRCPGRFTPGSTRWIGSWMGPTAGLDAMKEMKNLLPLPVTEPRFLGRPARSLVAITSKLFQLLCNYIFIISTRLSTKLKHLKL